jgi:hypothetical protein
MATSYLDLSSHDPEQERKSVVMSTVAARSREPQHAPALGRAAHVLSARKDDAKPNQSAR